MLTTATTKLEEGVLGDPEGKPSILSRKEAIGEINTTQGTLIKLAGEIRNQLMLQLKVAEVWNDIRARAEFEEEVLRAVEEEAPGVRAKIMGRIRDRKSLRGAVQI